MFRKMAEEKGMTLAAFGMHCEKDPAADHLIDERQREIALNSDNIIVEGRLSGWKIPEAELRIWLKAPLCVRTGRIYERDETADTKKAEEETRVREASEEQRYRQYYAIDIRDLTIYDMVLDSSRFTVEELAQIVLSALPSV